MCIRDRYVSMGSMVGLPQPSFLSGLGNAVSFAFTQFLMCLPILYVNRKYFQVGFKTLWHRAPNMDSLIAVGSTAALVYGIFAIYRMSYGLGVGLSLIHISVFRRIFGTYDKYSTCWTSIIQ